MQLSDLIVPLTLDDVRSAIYNVLAATGVTTTNWRPGAVVRTIITACAIVISSLSQLIALIARAGFLALSSGAWLTLVARYVYGVERSIATFATGYVTLVNVSGANYAIDPDDLTIFNPITNKSYRNTETIVLNGGTTVAGVAIRAVEEGSASTSFVGEITGVQTALDGVSCTNPQAVVGFDEETDTALKQRCSDKLGSLSGLGPRDAYGFAARSALRLDGTSIGVTRVSVERLPNGVMSIYVASATGPITGSASDPATDLGAVNEAIQQRATPLGITVNVYTVITTSIPVTYEVWLYNTASVDLTQIKSAISDQLLAYIAAQPIGGNVIPPDSGRIYISAIESVIGRATDASGAVLPFFRVRVTAPGVDVAVPHNSIAVLGSVTATAVNIVKTSGQ